MKQKFIDFLVSPKSGKKLKVKNPKVENSEIKSGTLLGDDDEYLIEEYIPRFVDNKIINQTQVSFGHKWQKYAQTALGKQEKNKKWFLEQYGWNENDFKNFISSRNKILDIGCGIGYVSNWVASESNADVFGVDISRSVDEAHKLFNPYKKNNLQFIQADISQLPFEKEFFDLIICKEMIHHTPDPRKNFSKLVQNLKPGGAICIYVYNKKGPIREFCDDYIRNFTTKLSTSECEKFAEAMTEFGKSLREMNIKIKVPKDIPFLDISVGEYDLQRFVYWNFFKCWWDDDGDKDYSNAVNFDWYHPPYAFRYSEEEFRSWFDEEDLKIENFNPLQSGFAVRAIKK